jgi:hypothetical protein
MNLKHYSLIAILLLATVFESGAFGIKVDNYRNRAKISNNLKDVDANEQVWKPVRKCIWKICSFYQRSKDGLFFKKKIKKFLNDSKEKTRL